MKTKWIEITIHGQVFDVEVPDEEITKADIKEVYFDWLELNKKIDRISTRHMNLSEAISENAFCLFFPNYIRVFKLKGGKSSFDVVNTELGRTGQLKATSVEVDITSFGPRSEQDEVHFLDFVTGDGCFSVYEIEPDWIYNCMAKKNQTVEQQCILGRRPRISVKKKIIEPRGLKPIGIFRLE